MYFTYNNIIVTKTMNESHSEGPGKAGEVGPQEPNEVQ